MEIIVVLCCNLNWEQFNDIYGDGRAYGYSNGRRSVCGDGKTGDSRGDGLGYLIPPWVFGGGNSYGYGYL